MRKYFVLEIIAVGIMGGLLKALLDLLPHNIFYPLAVFILFYAMGVAVTKRNNKEVKNEIDKPL